MQKKKKLKLIIPVFLLLIILSIPFPRYYKDGGTVEYHAVLYQVIQWHSLRNIKDNPDPSSIEYYYDGLEIKILGISVYNNAEEMEYRYCGD